MAGYSPLKITGMTTGLVQQREEFLLPNDAYPILQNAYVWRERIKRKKGYLLLGRLRRELETQSLGDTIVSGVQFNLFTQINLSGTVSNVTQTNPGSVTTGAPHLLQSGQFVTFAAIGGMTQLNGITYEITVTGASTFTIGVDTTAYTAYTAGGTWEVNDLSGETNKTIQPGSVVITMPGPIVFTDQGNGTLTSPTPGNSGIINYATGDITLTTTAGAGVSIVTFAYYPALPVMGIRDREITSTSRNETIFFDQVYAYVFNTTANAFEEFIPGTTWNAAGEGVDGDDFFWSTNYWVSSTPLFTTTNQKLFWVTNNTGNFGASGDPPRITDGTTWVSWWTNPGGTFTPQPWTQLDATNYLINWLSMLPFRGRMLVFNTWEGATPGAALNYSNRIRWSTIGNPFIAYTAGPPAAGSWRDDIRGQGGYLDIPTSEDIISVGFVRDNLVIYCERSTWQLRYTGRSIAPFQIERVNSELGGEGPFSAIQFDTSLVGVGDKGLVQCDSFKSDRIDVKIPDFVFAIQNERSGPFRVHGVRDFVNRLAFWTIPLIPEYEPRVSATDWIFPNTRLVYNYENDSWATFSDSLTTLGTYQPITNRTWLNTPQPWIKCNFSWIDSPTSEILAIVGGNQQGFVEYLDRLTTNDVSLYIQSVIPSTVNATRIVSPNHNMSTGFVISISGIPTGTSFDTLNGQIFGIVVVDADTFALYKYNPVSEQFNDPQFDETPVDPYIGGGLISIRDNFSIVSKKFNFLDEGENIQMGYLDILLAATELNDPGAISLKVYLDYNGNEASNTLPNNQIYDYSPVGNPDTFFNSVIPTTPSVLNGVGGTKFWQRVYCPTRSNFLTLEYTFSNAQMAGEEQTKDVQIDAQILWIRKAGRITQI